MALINNVIRLLGFCALISSCVSLPSSKGFSPRTGVFEDANFDERKVGPTIAGVNDLYNAVGVEKGLSYSAWVLLSHKTLGIPLGPIIPHSESNVIITAFEQQVPNKAPAITVNFVGSQHKTFTLQSFWFACALNNVEGIIDLAVHCSILVSGFKAGHQVAAATFSFTPTAKQALSAPMTLAQLPASFANLDTVKFGQTNPTVQVLALDDVEYYLN